MPIDTPGDGFPGNGWRERNLAVPASGGNSLSGAKLLLSALDDKAQRQEWRGNALMIRTVKVQGRPRSVLRCIAILFQCNKKVLDVTESEQNERGYVSHR